MGFYQGKRVFVTGHTGFKGSWLLRILSLADAEVMGYSLTPPTVPNLFEISDAASARGVQSVFGDIRDYALLCETLSSFQPDIIIHLAAQPLVLDSYENPRYTYEVNVMGTVNVLEAARNLGSVRSIVNVTTDKVYKNNDLPDHAFSEDEPLDGFDPYSNSKSCSELVTHSYAKSFLLDDGCAVSTARAGNVIGGGDFSANRIVPDCVWAAEKHEPLIIRNPYSTRPYQHVLEPLFAYLAIAQAQYENVEVSGSYNVGPDDCDCVTTGELVELFADSWGPGFSWVNAATDQNAPHEAAFLKLDSSKMKRVFAWSPRWHIAEAVQKTVEWTKAWLAGDDIRDVMDAQIAEYLQA